MHCSSSQTLAVNKWHRCLSHKLLTLLPIQVRTPPQVKPLPLNPIQGPKPSFSSLPSPPEHQATAAAWTWWSEVPLSYMSIIAISVACAFTFVTFVAVIVCLLRRRHVKGKASLPQVDMY